MKLQLDLSKVDFRSTPVENMFLDTYLSQAPAEALRVYLYGWKSIYRNPEGVSAEKILEDLHISPDQLIEALSYWMEEGLVTESRVDDQPVFLFRSMLLHWQGFYDEKEEADEATDLEGPALVTEEEEPSPLANSEDSQRRLSMFHGLEDFLSDGRPYRVMLKENEILLIQEILDHYPMTPEYFLYAYKKASEISESGSRSVHYLSAIVENWARFDGLYNKKDLDEFLKKKEEKEQKNQKFYRKKDKAKKAGKGPQKTPQEKREWVQAMLDRSRKRSLRGQGDPNKEALEKNKREGKGPDESQ